MSLIHRKIALVFAYGTGPDGSGTPRVATLTDHRASVSCVLAGGVAMPTVQVRVFGMSLSMMNELSTIGLLPNMYRPNTITVMAGDDVSGMAQIYQGTIASAWADMMAAPEVTFNVTGMSGLINALIPVPVSTYPGSADVAVIVANLADQMGLKFENNGVSVILSRPYFPGAARAQLEAVTAHSGVKWIIDNGTLAIWPDGGSRFGLIPLLSPSTGMVGYPSYTPTGIIVTTRFNPTIRFGAKVQVESSLTPANGQWQVVSLTHDIEAETPGGKWFTQLQLAAPGLVVVS